MPRLFVALTPPAELSAEASRQMETLREAARRSGAKVRWVPPEQLHLTLKFLGECEEDQVAGLGGALERVAASTPAFPVTFSSFGCFPPGGRPSVLWLGVSQGADSATRLAEAVQSACEGLGFPPEHRPFQAHLTIGRVKHAGRSLREAVESASAPRLKPFKAAAMELIESRLAPEGPTYTVRQRTLFKAAE